MLLIAVLVVSFASHRWSPQFDSQHLTNQTLQLAFTAHPPLREWVHAVMKQRRPDWRSVDDVLNEYAVLTSKGLSYNDVVLNEYAVDDVLNEYTVLTSRGLFYNDVMTIDTEYELRLGIDTKGRDLDTERIYELKDLLARLKSTRKKMDPSGGVNSVAVS